MIHIKSQLSHYKNNAVIPGFPVGKKRKSHLITTLGFNDARKISCTFSLSS